MLCQLITEVVCLVTAVLNDSYSEVTAYTVLAYFIGLVSTQHL